MLSITADYHRMFISMDYYRPPLIIVTIILPVVFYGCEIWSLTLREERRLKVFENRVLRGIFGPKRDGVTGEWRKLHNEELNFLKPTGHVMHQQFNIQQLYVLPTLYLCVLYLSENKQRLVPLTA